MAEELYATIAIGGAALLLAVVWCAAHLGAGIDHVTPPPANPVARVVALARR
jgi:hypothetical protein